VKLVGKTIRFIKKEPVLIIAAVLAAISMLIIHPDASYVSYIDFSVLGILFCLMIVVAGLMECGVFDFVSTRLIVRSKNVKLLALLLVGCVFFASMFVTNDVALIAFVPVTIEIFNIVGGGKLIFVVVLETIAANLGSMLTPIGNPQNLFLYSFFKMNVGGFLKITAPVTAVGFALIIGVLMFSRSGGIDIELEHKTGFQNKKPALIFYACLFVLSVLAVLHALDYRICVAVVFVGVLIYNRRLLIKVDYSLLFTFVAFFVFVGNIERVGAVKETVSRLISGHEFLLSVGASQFISNVPAAMMISHFTSDAKAVLLGVDIGGLGTPVASLASLISFKFYTRSKNAEPAKYMGVFSVYNFVLLGILVLIGMAMTR